MEVRLPGTPRGEDWSSGNPQMEAAPRRRFSHLHITCIFGLGRQRTTFWSSSSRTPTRVGMLASSTRMAVHEPELLLASAFDERNPMLSPDGRWLAYSSNESGRFQIYVQPFPGPGSRTQVSGEGGSWPVWSRTGEELFYSRGHDYFGQHDFISVGVVLGSSFEVTRERKLFGGGFAEGFDVAPDGQSFYVMEMRRIHSSGVRIQVVLN
ncbi:MAG: hypothetical protein E2P02_09985, partial [Acidobacteria bacterium]